VFVLPEKSVRLAVDRLNKPQVMSELCSWTEREFYKRGPVTASRKKTTRKIF